MKKIYGNEEQRLYNLKPKIEIPPELQRKLQKEKKRLSKQQRKQK